MLCCAFIVAPILCWFYILVAKHIFFKMQRTYMQSLIDMCCLYPLNHLTLKQGEGIIIFCYILYLLLLLLFYINMHEMVALSLWFKITQFGACIMNLTWTGVICLFGLELDGIRYDTTHRCYSGRRRRKSST